MIDQASANESFELIVWSLGRRCRWRARALGWSMSRRARRVVAGAAGVASVVVLNGAMRALVTTVKGGLAAWGR